MFKSDGVKGLRYRIPEFVAAAAYLEVASCADERFNVPRNVSKAHGSDAFFLQASGTRERLYVSRFENSVEAVEGAWPQAKMFQKDVRIDEVGVRQAVEPAR